MTLQYTALYVSSLVYATKVFSHTMTCACAKCEGERRVIIVHIGCTHILLQLESMALYVCFFTFECDSCSDCRCFSAALLIVCLVSLCCSYFLIFWLFLHISHNKLVEHLLQWAWLLFPSLFWKVLLTLGTLFYFIFSEIIFFCYKELQ